MKYKVYTPEKYATDMIKISLDRVLKEDLSQKIMSLKIIDLSCGSGNLLLPFLDELLKRTKVIFGEYKYSDKWITGYDLDKEALKLLKVKIKYLLFRYGIVTDKITLFNEDSLYADIEKEYDIVIGNPPYLGEKNNKEIFQNLRSTDFGKKYYSSKMDYFYFFVCKGIDILKKNGVLVYLTTNYWLKADSAKILREKLKNEGSYLRIENFYRSIFKKAIGQHNMIFFWECAPHNENIEILEENNRYFVNQSDIYDETGRIVLIPPTHQEVLKKIKKNTNRKLKDLLNINQGIVSGADKVFVLKKYESQFSSYLKPFYKNKDINKYYVSKNQFWILYLNENSKISDDLLSYLEKYKETLSNRREVKKEKIKWWQLQWARVEEIFLKPKIVVRQRCKTNNFAYTEKELYGSADIYYLTAKSEEINLFYILGYLNSKLFLFWYNYYGKRKGKNLEYYSTPLKEIPIYYPEVQEEIKIVSDLVKKQLVKYDEKIQQEIEKFFLKKFGIEDNY